MRTVCVIPARYGSQRLPGKPLTLLNGRPMIQWVVEAARRIAVVEEVIVATDHADIVAAVVAVGAEAIMTPPGCPSGTDRIQAALVGRAADVVVNVQGDEPAMPARAVELAHASLLRSGAEVATACVPILSREQFEMPSVVKVVRDRDDRALYFSRSPIPSLPRREAAEIAVPGYIWGYKHLGVYVYRRQALEDFCRLLPSSLENQEKLEQLRMLENGMRIQCVLSPADSVGVDVAEDIRHAEQALRALS